MNFVTIVGVVGSAETKYLQSGSSVLEFSLADSDGRDKGTLWWRCQLWGDKRVDGLAPYLVKGSKVTVVGQISEQTWTDKSGQERKSMNVRVSDVALQGKPSGSHDEPVREQKRPVSSGGGVTDEDIPFAPIRGALLLAM
jgi:single stranded DNA-binding protein